MAEIDSIIAACSAPEVSNYAREVDVLRSRRSEIGVLEDASTPGYFQSTAAGVAILAVARESPASDREWRIRSSVGNFWDSCDDILHAGGGYSRGEFQGIKTTLRGVEDAWRDGDTRLLSETRSDLSKVFEDRLSKVRSNYPKRRQIARVVAECAGWNIPADPV
ncbi:hypothetical protein [Streptomyces erythrochromogenes]|uniref:hypothetical protein n=1 Tax=Streptomyces erythrochromogenes TaxID=285574 RepID=UPI00369CCBFD